MSAEPPTRAAAGHDLPSTHPDDATTPALRAGTAVADAPQLPGYAIEGELGRGGMGVVYKAYQVGLNRPVAVKMVLGPDPADPKQLIRFLAEADAVAAIRHPNVVGVYEFGDHDGRPFLALEFCPGGSLADRLRRDGRLKPCDAALLVAQLADGVAAAHDRGVVHRDLKPANVLFDEHGAPKVADFGLARRDAGAGLTVTGAVMGTPAYMAPEQARGQNRFVGPQADVWSLGVVLYECLAGTRPFADSDPWGVFRKVTTEEPPPVRVSAADVHRDLELICLKCLRKEPADRYPAAGELAADLRRFLNGEPIVARPPGSVERVVKWVRRNPVPTGLIVALALLVAAVGAGGYLTNQQLQRANAEEVGRLKAERDKELAALQGAMQLALQSGNAKKAVAAFDEAVAAGLPVTPAMRLDKAKALYALNDAAGVRRELAALDRADLPPELRGPAELLDGVMLIGHDDAAAAGHVRRARELGLPPADDRYAEGLLARTAPEALAAFEAAFAADPAHVDARAMATMALLCLGRLDDAIKLAVQSELIAPAHPHFTAVLVASWILKGDTARAGQHLKAVQGQFADPRQYEAARKLFVVSAAAFGHIRAQIGGEGNPLAFAMQFLPGGELDRAVQGLGKADLPAGATLLRTPPFFRTAMALFVDEALASVQGGDGQNGPITRVLRTWLPGFQVGPSALWFTDAAGAAKARGRLRDHPEGTLKHLYANRLFEVANAAYKRSARDEASRVLLAEVGAAYEDAAATPGLFSVPWAALESAYLCYLMAGQVSARHPGKPEYRAKAVAVLRRRLQLAPPFRIPNQFMTASAVALRGGDDTLARTVLDQWARSAPTDWFYHGVLAQLDYKLGAYESALRSADRLTPTELAESSERDALAALRADCRKRLGLAELAPPPRAVRK